MLVLIEDIIFETGFRCLIEYVIERGFVGGIFYFVMVSKIFLWLILKELVRIVGIMR